MELDELMKLRLYAKSSKNKVVMKETFLSVLDSHIRLALSLDDRLVIRDKKMSYNERQALKSGIEQVRLPPTQEQVRKAYNVL